MLTAVIATLPPPAGDKLRDLIAAADDARARIEAARLPLKTIDKTRDGLRARATGNTSHKLSPDEEAELVRLDEEHARVMAKVEQRSAEYRAAAGLLAQVNQWLAVHHLGPNKFDLVPSSPAEPRAGRTIDGIREDIAATKADIARVKKAGLPVADLRSEIEAHVASLAKQGRPRMTGVNSRDRFAISWERGVHPAALLAWLNPDAFAARMVADLPAEDPDAMSPRMKSFHTDRLTGLLLDLERQEEALIEASSVPVARRQDADPAAVLGVEPRRHAVAA